MNKIKRKEINFYNTPDERRKHGKSYVRFMTFLTTPKVDKTNERRKTN